MTTLSNYKANSSNNFGNHDTIFALSSAAGKSAIAVYRLSGPKSLEIISSLSGKNEINPKTMYRALIRAPLTGEAIHDAAHEAAHDLIDDVMFVYFAGPNSFTGEDVVEIYAHGSAAVKKELTALMLSMDGVRYAEAGEFSRRGLINGKMDLTSIEGLMDLINSETSLQKKQALNQMRGKFQEAVNSWRVDIIKIMSLVEAFIDFPDEDIPEDVIRDSESMIRGVISSLEANLGDGRKGEMLRGGLKLAIYGKPNVGKSSLINYLTKRDVAIVSSIPGTTRDIIETHLDIGGYPIILQDTAGIRDAADEVEQEGIKRAMTAIDESDIRLFIQASNQDVDYEFAHEANTINVINKVDLVEDIGVAALDDKYIGISVKKNIGLDLLIAKIIELASSLAGSGDDALITQARHRDAIIKTKGSLERVNLKGDLVLAAEDLRVASRELGLLIGRVDIDEILDQIFSSFCIGK